MGHSVGGATPPTPPPPGEGERSDVPSLSQPIDVEINSEGGVEPIEPESEENETVPLFEDIYGAPQVGLDTSTPERIIPIRPPPGTAYTVVMAFKISAACSLEMKIDGTSPDKETGTGANGQRQVFVYTWEGEEPGTLVVKLGAEPAGIAVVRVFYIVNRTYGAVAAAALVRENEDKNLEPALITGGPSVYVSVVSRAASPPPLFRRGVLAGQATFKKSGINPLGGYVEFMIGSAPENFLGTPIYERFEENSSAEPIQGSCMLVIGFE